MFLDGYAFDGFVMFMRSLAPVDGHVDGEIDVLNYWDFIQC